MGIFLMSISIGFIIKAIITKKPQAWLWAAGFAWAGALFSAQSELWMSMFWMMTSAALSTWSHYQAIRRDRESR